MSAHVQRKKPAAPSSAPVQRRAPSSSSPSAPLQKMGYDEGRAAVSPNAAGPGSPDSSANNVQFDRGSDLADPELVRDEKTKKRETHEYKRYKGKLFKYGVRAQDVMQGWISNCYFGAGLAAVAQRHPDKIQEGIIDKGGDVFSVRFYKFDRWGTPTAVWIDVDADFPFYTDKKTWAYMQSTQKGELWPSLVEKAYAVFKAGGKGDYDAIGQGGWESEVMEAVTGHWAEEHDVAVGDADKLWNKIKKAASRGQAMSAGTYAPKEGGDGEDERYGDKTKIWENHAYTIMGVKESGRGRNKKRYVILRNPWGESEPDGNGKDDGIFKLPFDQFRKCYESLTILGLS